MLHRRAFLGASGSALFAQARLRPNILWISIEDTSPQIGCYGDKLARTPNIDRLATQGVRYTQAHSVIGVCAPSRSSIITGMYPPSLGTHHMRCTATLPEDVKCFPEYLRNAGYYCTNNVKTDYNFPVPKPAWDVVSNKAHWKNRPAGAPFFSVFNLTITHESHIPLRGARHLSDTSRLKMEERCDPAAVTVPPYYPDTPEVRRDLANVYDNIAQMDYMAGELLRELDQAGLAGDTIVFFWGDHGVGLPRAKRWLYNSSTHVPLVVSIPEKFRVNGQGKPGSVDARLVSLIDLGPTVLNLAGVPVPRHMQSQPFLGENLMPPRKYFYGARDRMDERYDMVRMVSDGRYRYIRNFDSARPLYQYMNTSEKTPTMRDLRRLHDEKKLHETADVYFRPKPREELYDTSADPHEVKNLAGVAQHKATLEALRRECTAWMESIRDLGLVPEPEILSMEKRYGSRAAIMRAPENRHLTAKLLRVSDAPNARSLVAFLADPQASVRCLAAQRLAVMPAKAGIAELQALLKDQAASVRIAAAQALAAHDESVVESLAVLERELAGPEEWARLAAAQALDELGPIAKPSIPAMRRARDTDENKYVSRVANRTINVLLGTKDEVE
ncbi:MAG: sulfatase-like hydrolase/transferase [Acidobacteria bacterium]|nr:sulfatase-like hydrolase/transferase [Acidobacteriota bacterium]